MVTRVGVCGVTICSVRRPRAPLPFVPGIVLGSSLLSSSMSALAYRSR